MCVKMSKPTISCLELFTLELCSSFNLTLGGDKRKEKKKKEKNKMKEVT